MTEPLDLLDPTHYETVRRPAAEAARCRIGATHRQTGTRSRSNGFS